MTCIRCKSCGVTPGKTWDFAWNHDEDLCPDCTLLHKKGGFYKYEVMSCVQVTWNLLDIRFKSMKVDINKVKYDFKTPQATSVPSATSAIMTTCNIRR